MNLLLGLLYAFLAHLGDPAGMANPEDTFETHLVEYATVVRTGGDPIRDVGSDTNVFVFYQGLLPADGGPDAPRAYDSYVYRPKRGADFVICAGYAEVTEHWFVACTDGRPWSLWMPECRAVSSWNRKCSGWCGDYCGEDEDPAVPATVLPTPTQPTPASDRIWRDKASEAILLHDKVWNVPVRVEDVRRDDPASAGEGALRFCEGGVWVGAQVLRHDPNDAVPPCADGRREACHDRNPCDVACPGAWGCRTTVTACCWMYGFLLACDADGETGRECLWEAP